MGDEPVRTEGAAQEPADIQKGKEAFETHEDVVITENEKAYGAALHKIFGLAENEELGNIEERIAQFEKSTADKLAKARDQVIAAEIKALQGYDSKLLDRLIDRSKITFDESGKVSGIEEAVKAVEVEFPSVRLKEEKQHKPFMPVNPAGVEAADSINKTMNDLIRGKR